MCQRIHAGGGSERLGQRVHQFRVDNGHGRNVVGIDAHHFLLFLLVDNHIVDGHFSACSCCGGQCDDRHRLVGGGSATFERHHIGKVGIGHHDSDTFGRVHRRTTANGNDTVGSRCLESLHALLHIGNGWVGFDFAIHLIGKSGFVEHVGHHFCCAHLQQSFVGSHQCLVQVKAFQHIGQLFACTCSKIRYFVKNKSVHHNVYRFKNDIFLFLIVPCAKIRFSHEIFHFLLPFFLSCLWLAVFSCPTS